MTPHELELLSGKPLLQLAKQTALRPFGFTEQTENLEMIHLKRIGGMTKSSVQAVNVYSKSDQHMFTADNLSPINNVWNFYEGLKKLEQRLSSKET